MKTRYAVLGVVITTAAIALAIMSYPGSVSTSALAVSVPNCPACSISGNGVGVISLPKTSQFGVSCLLCKAKIEFHAQSDNGKITGTLSITYFPGGPCNDCVISGGMNGGVIVDKAYALKGLSFCNRCGPDHFTLNGIVSKGSINFYSQEKVGRFAGEVTVSP